MTAGSLTGVMGVARRHRARRNTGGPPLRGVAAFTSACRRKPRWVSEGSIVPIGPTRQQNWWGGKAPWFGVRLDEPKGRRVV
jgi:hypothetical protein